MNLLKRSYKLIIFLCSTLIFIRCSPKIAPETKAPHVTVQQEARHSLNNKFDIIALFTFRGATEDIPSTKVALYNPNDVALDSLDNLYIADFYHNRVLKIDAITKKTKTVAGNGMSGFDGDSGPAVNAQISRPTNITLDKDGNLYIADEGNNRVRKVNSQTGIITTIAGEGYLGYNTFKENKGIEEFADVGSLAVDKSGNIYVGDRTENYVKKINQTTGKITIFAGIGKEGMSGDGGPATLAEIARPYSLAFDKAGNLFIADEKNSNIREVNFKTGIITSVPLSFELPIGIAFDSKDNLYVSDLNDYKIWKVDLTSHDKTVKVNKNIYRPQGMAVDRAGNVYFANRELNTVCKLEANTGKISVAAGTELPNLGCDTSDTYIIPHKNEYKGMIDNEGNLFIPDYDGNRLMKIDLATGVVSFMNGFASPVAITIDKQDNIYVADRAGHSISKMNHETGKISLLTSNLVDPVGIILDDSDNIYIADEGSSQVKKYFQATKVMKTIAGHDKSIYPIPRGDGGPALSATILGPESVAVDRKGNVYLTEHNNPAIRKVDAKTGIITTIAGGRGLGYEGEGGPADSAKLEYIMDLVVDSADNLYFVNTPCGVNCMSHVRKIDSKTGIITTVAGNESITDPMAHVLTNFVMPGREALATDSLGTYYIPAIQNNRMQNRNYFHSIASYPFIPSVDPTGRLLMKDERNDSLYSLSAHAVPFDIAPPVGVAEGRDGSIYYSTYREIYSVDSTDTYINLIAGNGSSERIDNNVAINSSFWLGGVVSDWTGNLYISDLGKFKIYKIDGKTGIMNTIAGNGKEGYNGDDGQATQAELHSPYNIAVDSIGNVYFIDRKEYRIRRIDALTGTITTIAGNGFKGSIIEGSKATEVSLDDFSSNFTPDQKGNIYLSAGKNIFKINANSGIINSIFNTDKATYEEPLKASYFMNGLAKPFGIDSKGIFYINQFGFILKIDTTAKKITPIAGNGFNEGSGCDALAARIGNNNKCCLDKDGNIYILGNESRNLRKIDAKTGKIYILAGAGWVNTKKLTKSMPAETSGPACIFTDPAHKRLYIEYLMIATANK